jgi:hypothetical protein
MSRTVANELLPGGNAVSAASFHRKRARRLKAWASGCASTGRCPFDLPDAAQPFTDDTEHAGQARSDSGEVMMAEWFARGGSDARSAA